MRNWVMRSVPEAVADRVASTRFTRLLPQAVPYQIGQSMHKTDRWTSCRLSAKRENDRYSVFEGLSACGAGGQDVRAPLRNPNRNQE